MRSIDFDYIVVGRGLTGSAAARHLCKAGARVGLIGPEEPSFSRQFVQGNGQELGPRGDRNAHCGVFASHYDEGRITRIIDPQRHWALFAQRSIARYRSLEAFSGVSFYGEVGHLAVGQDAGDSRRYLEALRQVAAELAVEIEVLEDTALKARFPCLQLPCDAVGLWQRQHGGYISPRAHVKAQAVAVERSGGQLVAQEALSVKVQVDGVCVETAAGSYTSRGVIVATGGFTQARALLPRRLALTVKAHTVLLAEVQGSDLEQLRQMPSLISKAVNPQDHFYLLPPILYPDGRWYLKIGCSDTPPIAGDFESLQSWFRGQGDGAIADRLKALLLRTLPEINFASYWVDTCVTTHTPTGYPYIGALEVDPIVALVGGNGYAGKSADELGFIAARLLHQRRWVYDLSEELFKVRYAC